MTFTVVPLLPSGSHDTLALVNRGRAGCGVERTIVQDYPPSPRGRALRDARVDVSLGLGKAAVIFGLSPADLSAIEHGRATFATDAEWDRALEMIRGAA